MTRPIDVRIQGPLVRYHGGFCAELKAQGYTSLSAANLVRLFAHLSRWMAVHRLDPRELTQERLSQFLQARKGYTCWRTERGLRPILDHLRRLAVIPASPPPALITPLDRFLAQFGAYLQTERGLARSTIQLRLRVARRFLTPFADLKEIRFDQLTTSEVMRFVLRESRQCSVGYAKAQVSDLRSLLRYLHLQGHSATPLAGAAPAVAGWRLTSLPRGLELNQLQRLFDACDRRTARGRRDFALLKLLLRLGLRVGEVAALTLDDLDWRRGELVIHGKGQQEERLPLPEDVGEALVSYLRRARPKVASRAVFVSSRAPHRALSSGGLKSRLRVGICSRAEVPPIGTHRLRHTAATRILQAGSSLSEVAQVLRHRSVLTTAIYAKVDRRALRALALSWPGGQP